MSDEPFPSDPTADTVAAPTETSPAGSGRRGVVAVVVALAFVVAAFVGGRVTAPDPTVASTAATAAHPTSAADAIAQARAGTLPCGTLTGPGNKALQKVCTPSGGGKAAGGKNRRLTPSAPSATNSSSTSATSSTG